MLWSKKYCSTTWTKDNEAVVFYALSLGTLLYILKGMESQALDMPRMKM